MVILQRIKMSVIIITEHRTAVMAILSTNGYVDNATINNPAHSHQIILGYQDDEKYLEMAQWGGSAIACGLVNSFRIERI